MLGHSDGVMVGKQSDIGVESRLEFGLGHSHLGFAVAAQIFHVGLWFGP